MLKEAASAKSSKLALIVGNKLGDGIIAMSLRDRLTENGYSVTVFGNAIEGLKGLFPKANIELFPQTHEAKKTLSSFNILVYPQQEDNCGFPLGKEQKQLVFREDYRFHVKKPMRKIYEQLSSDFLDCEHTYKENSLKIPKSWQKSKVPNRVVIHPMSGEVFRNWSKRRFIKLAKRLKKKGFNPVFVVSRKDLTHWEKQVDEVKSFDNLIDLAEFFYESGSFIGNDSGPGHLAALLSVPTLTLCARNRSGKCWAPSDNPRAVLYSTVPLIGPYLQGKYWKHFISVGKCYRRFCEIVK